MRISDWSSDVCSSDLTPYSTNPISVRKLHMSIISIIGSGGMAAAIAGLAAKAGHTLEVVSRDPVKARALVEQVGGGATTGTYDAAPVGDIVILAVPYSAVLDVVKQYGEKLAGKVRSEEHTSEL